MEQLTYAGVFEAVQIRKSGFPFRLPHRRFANRYRCLAYKESGWVSLGARDGDYKGMCAALLRCVNQVGAVGADNGILCVGPILLDHPSPVYKIVVALMGFPSVCRLAVALMNFLSVYRLAVVLIDFPSVYRLAVVLMDFPSVYRIAVVLYYETSEV